MPYRILLLLIVTMIPIGCSNSGDTAINGGSSSSGNMMPLAIGNSWTYEVEPSDSANGVPFFTDSVIEFDTIAGHTWAMVQRSSLAFPFFRRNATDGLHDGPTFDNLIAKYPSTQGDVFVDTILVMDDSVTIGKGFADVVVAHTNEEISVPAGNFSTYHYESPLVGPGLTDAFYAPGVGMVEMSNFNGSMKYVLLRYSLH